MQIFIQVLTTAKTSLRDTIVNDKKLEKFGLMVSAQKKVGRSHGWAKVHSSTGAHGAINIEWDAPLAILHCRVVTKGEGKPEPIISDFVEYLLTRHAKKVQAINILPR